MKHILFTKNGQNQYYIQAVNSGQCCAVSSEISLLEILVQPLRLGLNNVVNDYKNLLDNFPHLTWCSVTREVALQAATLRAKYKLRTPDALIIATGITQGATLMITNDTQWKQISEIQIICLRDLEDK